MSANIITEKLCKLCGTTKPTTKEHWHWSPENLAKCHSWCKLCASARRYPNKKTASQLFWSRVDKSGGEDACWPWAGTRHYRGYGKFGSTDGHERFAHRFAYADYYGPIGPGLEVRHACDNPPCCNPRHLSLGTHQDNMTDMVVRNRVPDRRGEKSPSARLTAQQVTEIRRRVSLGEAHASVALSFAVSLATISAIVTRRIWKHLP